MQALQIFAGSAARAAIAAKGLQPDQVHTIPAAAGGPKGLILGALDRYLFGEWLPRSEQAIDLVGASIGAWRMATACLDQPPQAFARLAHDYAHQHYPPAPGKKRPDAASVSGVFGGTLQRFFEGRVDEVLTHPRYRLHLVTSRGRHVLRREHRLATPLGYLGAFLSNAVHRPAMGAWLERVVFSAGQALNGPADLPFDCSDYRTRQAQLKHDNFLPALQASCSIPFVLESVSNIPGAAPGAYWDGGITDYHLHLNYAARRPSGVVLYPHFQQSVVPGWLDKQLRWRHAATPFLRNVLLLAPHPDWVRTLPLGKLPDRSDFAFYGDDLPARVRAWTAATSASQQLADEFADWLERPDMRRVLPL
jgi:hypothetical protein